MREFLSGKNEWKKKNHAYSKSTAVENTRCDEDEANKLGLSTGEAWIP